MLCFDMNFSELCPCESSTWQHCIGSGYGLFPVCTKRAIINELNQH